MAAVPVVDDNSVYAPRLTLAAKTIDSSSHNPVLGSPVPFYLSASALILSVIALAKGFLFDPLGSGISSYDFTSPTAALTSSLDMAINGDVRAEIELSVLKFGKSQREKRKTFKVHRESDYQGKRFLFVSYTENGLPKHSVEAFEKDTDTALWIPKYFSRYDIEDSAMEKAVKEWEKNGGKGEE